MKTVITVVIAGVLLGSTGFAVWYWQSGEIKKQRTQSEKIISDLQKQVKDVKSSQLYELSKAIDNKDWGKYKDNTNGYSIEYPEQYLDLNAFVEPDGKIRGAGFYTIGAYPKLVSSIEIVDKPNVTAKDYANNSDRTGVYGLGGLSGAREFKSQNGLLEYEDISNHMGIVNRNIFIADNNKVYKLKLVLSDESINKLGTEATSVDTFEKMASSFKFSK